MEENTLLTASAPTLDSEGTPSKGKRIFKMLAWSGLFLFFLLLFTFMKIPEDRVREYVLGQANAALAPMGMTMSAREGSLSLLLRPSYALRDVNLTVAGAPEPVVIDKLEIFPSFSALLTGKIGARFVLLQGDGSLEGVFKRNLAGTDNSFAADIVALNVGKLGVLAASPLNIKANAIITGKVDLVGDFTNLGTISGEVALKLTRLAVQSARIMIEPSMNYGIDLPKFSISEGEINVGLTNGKLRIQTFNLGKGPSDDIRAKITGDATLGRFLSSTIVNLRANLSFSPELMKSMSLFDTLYSTAKQADGSYQLQINGPMSGPSITAAPGGAAPSAPAAPAAPKPQK